MLLDPDKLRTAAVADLLSTYAAILQELRERQILRTNNAPAGDYAEYLVHRALGGELAGNSTKSWDLRLPNGDRIQVKARVVTDPSNKGERQLSPFRSEEFDAVVVVLFDREYRVFRAARIPREMARAHWRFVEHVRGNVLHAYDPLFELPDVVDLTSTLEAARRSVEAVPA